MYIIHYIIIWILCSVYFIVYKVYCIMNSIHYDINYNIYVRRTLYAIDSVYKILYMYDVYTLQYTLYIHYKMLYYS